MKVVGNSIRGIEQAHRASAAIAYPAYEIKKLVEQAADGNFEAFGELYNIYIARIYRYVLYQVNDVMTAEDITEDVFLKAWKAIHSCTGKSDTFTTWLYRIAHNHLINSLRNRYKFTSIDKENADEIKDPKSEVEKWREHQELLELLTCLPPGQKQVIILKFIEDMDNKEIGKIVGKREGAVRVLQMRALAKLRQTLVNEQWEINFLKS